VQPDDIPPPDQPITSEVYFSRWPSGAEKVELFDGSLVFTGIFDERDVEMAERTYPGAAGRAQRGRQHPGASGRPA
jgi:hypothetical protein